MKAERCHIQVMVRGLNFPRWRQCERTATTQDEAGKPVCKQHSPEAKKQRSDKADAIRLKRRNLYLAYIRSKNPA